MRAMMCGLPGQIWQRLERGWSGVLKGLNGWVQSPKKMILAFNFYGNTFEVVGRSENPIASFHPQNFHTNLIGPCEVPPCH